jgi:large-conductance mechanosensitive channel
MRSLLLLVVLLGGATVVSTAAVCLVRRLVPLAVLASNHEVAGNYLQVLGTLFAVLLAFVVFVVWSQYNEARTAVEREANEIADLHRSVSGLAAEVRDGVREELQAYVRAVVDEEWQAMARGGSSERAASTLEQIWCRLSALEPQAGREEALFTEALARFNDLSDMRTHRLLSSRIRLPATLWLLLLTGALLTVGSMLLFGPASLAAHALMTSAIAGLICFVLYVVADLDNPFWGDWRISPEPMLQALRRSRGEGARSAGSPP